MTYGAGYLAKLRREAPKKVQNPFGPRSSGVQPSLSVSRALGKPAADMLEAADIPGAALPCAEGAAAGPGS